MKKAGAFGMMLVLTAFLMAGCGGRNASSESMVSVKGNGRILAIDVEAFDTAIYNFDELSQYVEDTVDAYNEEHGKGCVKMKNLELFDGNAVMTTQYDSAADYAAFTGTELFTGSVAEALAAGFPFSEEFARIDKGVATPVSAEEIRSEEGLKIVIIRANTTVQVKGTVLYTTVDNVASVKKNTVVIAEGANILMAGVTEQATETQSTQSTEDVAADESVDEDALLDGEDEAEMITFDFGDETADTEVYSNVYTYIIYK